MNTNCLDLMDLLDLNQTESNTILLENYSQHQKIPSRNTSMAPTNKTISTRLYSQVSSRKQTQETGYRSIAYSFQISRTEQTKQKQRSISFTPNLDQMQQSFEKMELKMNKFQLSQPDRIDQKYMITGFLSMFQDYQNIIKVIKMQAQDLNASLQSYNNNYYEQAYRVDSYFQKNSQLLTTNVFKYYKIKESLYRFLRMGIQEPYNQRVQKKIDLLEKQNHLFEYFKIYLELFKFINQKAFDCFKKDLIFIHSLQQSTSQLNFGDSFFKQIQEFKHKILIISSTQEASILNRIFLNKIDEIQQWIQLILKMANFKYVYYIKYLLVSKSQLKKIIKSKKLFDQITPLLEEAEQYQANTSTLNILYKDEIHKFVSEFNQIKTQIIDWNVRLKEDPLCQLVLVLIKMNLKLERVNKNLQILNALRESDDFDSEHLSQEVDMVQKLNDQLLINSHIINQIKQHPDIKYDEYIQYQLFLEFII
ncbi:unnamed protein product (macronuclear) [Paramecium tetraurelia]|uniref:DH domain-containing protein n=1 Tax=Paramecium tetraurelia TaxID=5888 RepID=A0DRY8_PARTE|nr:uncharacterized protein GSPATT00019509001 [Paramecium tetraurelia]CAK85805.1 unnamed protein product [Paramecium tetraurelia]|eukprot:XP_001453202.1 hypothetical protein (macronuclear) [Paramecium tetraurelia strain d4-2]